MSRFCKLRSFEGVFRGRMALAADKSRMDADIDWVKERTSNTRHDLAPAHRIRSRHHDKHLVPTGILGGHVQDFHLIALAQKRNLPFGDARGGKRKN